MAISDLTEKILADAKEQVAEINKESSNKIDAVTEEVKKQIATLTDASKATTEKILEDNERRVVSSALHEAKIELDSNRRDALAEVFVNVYKQLLSLPEKEYEAVITKLLKSLPAGLDGTIVAPTQRMTSTEKTLKSLGLSFTTKADNSIEGGFILVGKDFEYNYTFKKILESKKSESDIEVAQILFS